MIAREGVGFSSSTGTNCVGGSIRSGPCRSFRRPVRERRDRDAALLGDCTVRQAVEGPTLEQAQDVRTRMVSLHPSRIGQDGDGEKVGLTRQLHTSQAPFVSNDQPSGNVSVRFVFVEEDCGKRYAAEMLTPNDNFTGFVRALNGTPNSRGYFFVYASGGGDNGENDVPIVFNETHRDHRSHRRHSPRELRTASHLLPGDRRTAGTDRHQWRRGVRSRRHGVDHLTG